MGHLWQGILLGDQFRGRSKLRLVDCIDEDFTIIGKRNRNTLAKRRAEWKKIIGMTNWNMLSKGQRNGRSF